MLALRTIRPWALLGAALVAAAFLAPSTRAAQPSDSPPSYLFFAKESKSPLITAAYPLHRAVAYWDLAGVKAAVEQGKSNVNQAVMHKQSGADKSFGYTPLAVAMQSHTRCGFDCRYYDDEITDIIYYLLCSGANPNTAMNEDGASPLLAAATANGNYPLAYALLVSSASTTDATDALQSLTCGYKATEDQRSALTNALLLAHGAEGARKKLERGFVGARDWQGGKCVMPAGGRKGETTCYSTCRVLSEGLTAADATALKGGKIPPSLATRLELTPEFLGEASAALGEAAAGIKACPAKTG